MRVRSVIRLWAGASAACALLLTGCAAPPDQNVSRPLRPFETSATARGVNLRVSVPTVRLAAGSKYSATVTLTNVTTKPVEVTVPTGLPVNLWVTDARGSKVWDWDLEQFRSIAAPGVVVNNIGSRPFDSMTLNPGRPFVSRIPFKVPGTGETSLFVSVTSLNLQAGPVRLYSARAAAK